MSATIDLAGLGVLVVDPCDPPDGWIGRADAASVEVWLEVAEAYRQRMGSQSMVAGGSCALQLAVETNTNRWATGSRSWTARRTCPGCRATSTTASHIEEATAASASGSSRSTCTSAAPVGTVSPRATHVT